MQGPCVTAIEEDGDDRRHVELEYAAKLMVLHHQILFILAKPCCGLVLSRCHPCTGLLLGT